MDVFIGTILPFGFNYPPSQWMTCQGQILAIAQYNALFALLGVTYGGNGTVTFGLPDLQGRTMLGMGSGVGRTVRTWGETGGTESVILLATNLPIHNHPATATLAVTAQVQVSGVATGPLTVPSAANSFLGASSGGAGAAAIWSTAANTPVNMAGVTAGGTSTVTVGMAGQSQPVSLMNPYLAMNFCISLFGIYPSRD